MSDEDRSVPIILEGPGWEQLPDGTWQLSVECPTEVHYITLPKTLCIGDEDLYRDEWDSERKLAFYRSGGDTVAGC